jgi:hypothetical protein
MAAPSGVPVLGIRHPVYFAPIFHLGVLKGQPPIALGDGAPPI